MDFGSYVIPIEVKYRTFGKIVIGRSLKSFIERYRPDKAYVVTPKDFSIEQKKIINTSVIFVPFWKFYFTDFFQK